ncbi:ki-ras-induced actin-interacting protein-IP3R-interacting domain olf186-M [Dermatophagoides pteronyssinus]|uniref:ki-ras-induced actin-interacting protein-IP3R-interacting domain olf186-M n=1 Tax=Dermatophagoides pteronyssinus TaxID=6956 RepID=UPI003F677942
MMMMMNKKIANNDERMLFERRNSTPTTPTISSTTNMMIINYNYNKLISLNQLYNNSINSDDTLSSISSIDSLLESRRENPEEILCGLGFAASTFEDEINPLSRIPKRFFRQQSLAKGVNVDKIIEMIMINNEFLQQSSSSSYYNQSKNNDLRMHLFKTKQQLIDNDNWKQQRRHTISDLE